MNHASDDAIDKLLREQFDGPIHDEGFSERMLQRLPPRRSRVAWPLWAGMLAGACACWLALLPSPLLHAGWRDWSSGAWSTSTVIVLLAMVTMAVLALAWGVAEVDDR